MTDKEKLDIAKDFIQHIERLNVLAYDDVYGFKCIHAHVVDELKDKAWHVLADITE